MRLDKYLHDLGFGTRSDIDRLIRSGSVMIDGVQPKNGSIKVKTNNLVTFNGEVLTYEPTVYIMLYKPADVVSATVDANDETVLDLLPERFSYMNVASIGRLDKDTTGLLLLTNDGSLSHFLTSPKRHVDKLYDVHYEGTLAEDAVVRCEQGIQLGDFTTAPARLDLLDAGHCWLTIHEGKFHQVKRMIHALGGEVTALSRLQFGGLALDETLSPGEWRFLTEEEVSQLKQASNQKGRGV